MVSVVSQSRPEDGCVLQARPLSKEGPGQARETPVSCGTFDIVAGGDGFLAAVFAPDRVSLRRLAADGSVPASTDLPAYPGAAADALVRVGERAVALKWPSGVAAASAFSIAVDGLELSPTVPVAMPPDAFFPQIASVGDHASVVWVERPDPAHLRFLVRALDVDAFGRVIVPARDLVQGDGMAYGLRVGPTMTDSSSRTVSKRSRRTRRTSSCGGSTGTATPPVTPKRWRAISPPCSTGGGRPKNSMLRSPRPRPAHGSSSTRARRSASNGRRLSSGASSREGRSRPTA